MRASEGERLSVQLVAGEELDDTATIGFASSSSLLSLNRNLVTGDDLQTYTLTADDSSIAPSFSQARLQHLVIRPSDVEGAEFAIESVRLISPARAPGDGGVGGGLAGPRGDLSRDCGRASSREDRLSRRAADAAPSRAPRRHHRGGRGDLRRRGRRRDGPPAHRVAARRLASASSRPRRADRWRDRDRALPGVGRERSGRVLGGEPPCATRPARRRSPRLRRAAVR